MPDHSILSGTFLTSSFRFDQSEQSSFEPFSTIPEKPSNKPPRKNRKKIDDKFFMSDETRQLVLDTIAKLETASKNQAEINRLWLEVKTLFLDEMGSLPNIPSSNCKKMNRNFRKSTTFWNNELANLWFSACQAEKNYTSYKVSNHADSHQKKNLRQIFKEAQSHFDKKYRYFKRQDKIKTLMI